jgi:hypothetical protein
MKAHGLVFAKQLSWPSLSHLHPHRNQNQGTMSYIAFEKFWGSHVTSLDSYVQDASHHVCAKMEGTAWEDRNTGKRLDETQIKHGAFLIWVHMLIIFKLCE